MLELLVHWDTILKILQNTLLVSIPEEVFLIMFTLAFNGEYSFLETGSPSERRFYKSDYIKLINAVVITALLSNILRYSGINIAFSMPINIITILITISTIYDLWNYPKEIWKSFLFLLLAILITVSLELLYIPLAMYFLGKTVEDINNSIVNSFILSLPERLIEYTLIAVILSKKAAFFKTSLLKSILSSKFLTSVSSFLILFNFASTAIVGILIAYYRILNEFPLYLQLAIVIGVIMFPLVNLSALIGIIFYKDIHSKNSNYQLVKSMENNLKSIKVYAKNSRYDKININLKLLESDIVNLKRKM